MCKRVWRIVQDCAKKQGLVAGFCGWLAPCKLPECCTRAKHARSWRVAPAVALQDKSPRLARPFARGLNSRLNPVARSSRQNTLFGKKLTFHIPSHRTIYIPLYPQFWESFQREFWERNLREKQDWLIHNDFSNSSTLTLSIVTSLRDSLTKSFSHLTHICEKAFWCFGKC